MTDETLPTNNDFFGTPSIPGAFGFKYHTISDKEPSVYRIAPPIKSLRMSGKWNAYDSLHQGYNIPNEQNPDKPRYKPFRCIFKRDRNKMVTQDCPECIRIDVEKKKLEEMVKGYAAQLMAATPGLSEEDALAKAAVASKTSPQAVLVDKFYVDRKYYVLAKNVAGEWGILKLPPSLIWGKGQKGALTVLMDKFSAENNGVSALDPNVGVWFKFKRTGQKWTTTYTVEIETENVGGGAFRYKAAPLNHLDIAGLEKCPDLGTYNEDKTLSYDQILTLAQSGNNPAIISSVFASTGRRTPPPAAPAPMTMAAPAPRPLPPPAPVEVPAAFSAPTPTLPPAAVAPAIQEDELTSLRRQLAEMEARKAALVAPPAVTQPAMSAPTATPTPAAATTAGKSFAEMMKLDSQAFLDMFPDANKK